ncbi:MAG: hypothetical protein FWF97_02180 [Alphaproteobacteria bacterium]|nr:hypothetical protein [Alphaproteobacteria bacterium]
MRKITLFATVLLIGGAVMAPALATGEGTSGKSAWRESLTEQQRECIRDNCPKFTREEKATKSDAEWQAKRDCYEACGVHKDWSNRTKSKM